MDLYNILLVDDEVSNLNALERALRREYSVFSATNGEDALAIMKQNDIALIIADYRMPGMTGVELLEKVLQRYPNTIRIILTAYTNEKLLMDAINTIRVHGYLAKPWNSEEITSLVRKWRIAEAKREMAEAALRKSEEKYRLLIENSGTAIAAISGKGDILLLNNTAAMELGGQKDDFIGKSLYDIFPKDVVDEYMEGIRRSIKSGVGYTIESMVDLYSGSKWFSSNIQPIIGLDGNVSYVQTISQDITERKKVEKRLIRSEKLASIGRLSANLAHELSNPLDGVRRYVRLLLDQMSRDDPRRAYVEQILDGLMRVANMVSGLLHFARRSTPVFMPIDIPQSIRRIISSFSDQISTQRIKVKTEFDKNIPVVFNADVEQIFMNIIKNAIQAMPNNGAISVKVQMLSPQLLEARISDTGPGIPSDMRETIFDPFFTTKDTGQGVGLGLSISHGIAESYDGTIDVESKMGEGTTFIVKLPIGDGGLTMR